MIEKYSRLEIHNFSIDQNRFDMSMSILGFKIKVKISQLVTVSYDSGN